MKIAFLSTLTYCPLLFLATVTIPMAVQNEQLTLSASDLRVEPVHLEQNTSNFIFASFAGLLQQWPNTFAYSGHSIIPGTIPKSTLLYHGTNRREPPPLGMEWLAFNPEMSYSIHSIRRDQVDLYTYVATRPLRVIYIDGQSASLGTPGFMDSQSVLINNTVDEEFGDEGHYLEAEYERADKLCKIGKIYGFEGVVRMNTGFELIWCDFTQGIEIIQVSNVTDPFAASQSKIPHSGNHPRLPDQHSAFWSRAGWMNALAASRQFFAPGEFRVKLDPSGFISFYDRLESLNLKRRADGTEQSPRSHHRLFGISTNDANTIHQRLIEVLSRKAAEGWQQHPQSPDWQGKVLTIVQTYSQPLIQLDSVLKDTDLSAIEIAIEVRSLSYRMLMPYVDFSCRNLSNTTWASQSIKKCSTAFTTGMYHSSHATESIQVIISAIESTLNRLCSNIYNVFSQTMEMALPIESPVGLNSTLEIEAKFKIVEWRKQTEELMKWLGWSTWGHCNPTCKPNEHCLPPMWPSVRGNFTDSVRDYPVCHDFSSWRNSQIYK